MQPLVSIIIPTRNSAQYLAATLESLRAQTYPHIEIIISDNASTDKTHHIAMYYGARFIASKNERSAQLNEAIMHAKGTYVYRVDSDFLVDPAVVAECVALCEQGADAVAVHNDSSPDISFWSRVRNLERQMYRNDKLIVGARFFRKTVLDSINGFDEALVAGEDYDIHNRILQAGYTIVHATHGEIHLGEPKTLGEIWSKSFYYGRTITKYIQRHPQRAAAQFFPVRSAYLRHWPLLLKHPILTAGIGVVTVTKYTAAGLGALTDLLTPRARR